MCSWVNSVFVGWKVDQKDKAVNKGFDFKTFLMVFKFPNALIGSDFMVLTPYRIFENKHNLNSKGIWQSNKTFKSLKSINWKNDKRHFKQIENNDPKNF